MRGLEFLRNQALNVMERERPISRVKRRQFDGKIHCKALQIFFCSLAISDIRFGRVVK